MQGLVLLNRIVDRRMNQIYNTEVCYMKKIMIAGAVAALMFTAGTAAFAAKEANDTAKADAAAAAPCYHQFVDANNDGVFEVSAVR